MNPILKPISVVLKEARNNKGISLDEAYRATKIHPNILRSLEEGTTLQLSEVYVKSYIKIYAKYLGIGESELEQYFRPARPKEKKKVSNLFVKPEQEKLKSFVPPASLSNINTFMRVRLQQFKFLKIIVIAIAIIIMFALIKLASNSRKRASLVPLKTFSQTDIDSTKTSVPKKVDSKEQIAKKESRPTIGNGLRLTIFAEEDTWIQVRQDGQLVFRRTLKKFSSETWQAKEKFELRISNAGTIKIELDGKIISPIGRKGQPLRKVIITKEGFKIEK